MDRQLAAIAHRAMEARGFDTDFSAQEMREVTGRAAVDPDPAIRTLSQLQWLSADHDGTRNPEQVVVAEQLGGGEIRVRVAVSDIDAAVPEGSPLDRRARNNGQAVYGPGENFPMLPWELLDGQTAFVEREPRLAVVTDFVVTDRSGLGDWDCYRARVESHGQLSYSQLADWLPRKFPRSATGRQMELQARAAARLSVRRAQVELVGFQEGMRPAEEMVEELMKTTNEVAARFLDRSHFPVIFQTIGSPEHWDRIVVLAERHQSSLPGRPDPAALGEFLKSQKARLDTQAYADLALVIEKLLGRTFYAVKEAGKPFPVDFQLSLCESTRSTSPSRDYASLCVQRLLKAAIAGEPPPPLAGLQELVAHCNRRRDDAYKVKRQVYKSKDAFRLASQIGHTFQGTVTGSAEKGTWVLLAGKPVEGRVVGDIRGVQVGDPVRVRLQSVDPQRGYIDFELD